MSTAVVSPAPWQDRCIRPLGVATTSSTIVVGRLAALGGVVVLYAPARSVSATRTTAPVLVRVEAMDSPCARHRARGVSTRTVPRPPEGRDDGHASPSRGR